MKPRWEPSWGITGAEVFIGQAGELDVYYELHRDENGDRACIYVVCGPERQSALRDAPYNYDCYYIKGGQLQLQEAEIYGQDVHVELAEMCLIYEMAVHHGYMKV